MTAMPSAPARRTCRALVALMPPIATTGSLVPSNRPQAGNTDCPGLGLARWQTQHSHLNQSAPSCSARRACAGLETLTPIAIVSGSIFRPARPTPRSSGPEWAPLGLGRPGNVRRSLMMDLVAEPASAARTIRASRKGSGSQGPWAHAAGQRPLDRPTVGAICHQSLRPSRSIQHHVASGPTCAQARPQSPAPSRRVNLATPGNLGTTPMFPAS